MTPPTRAFRPKLLFLSLLVPLLSLSLASACPALATVPAPSWQIQADALPADVSPTTGGHIALLVTNAGGAVTDGSPVTVTDTLPAGFTVVHAEYSLDTPNDFERFLPCSSTDSTVTCVEESTSLQPENAAGIAVQITVSVESSLLGLTLTNLVAVHGGGAPSVATSDPLPVGASELPFGFDGPATADAFAASGGLETQAASHPSSASIGFVLNTAAPALDETDTKVEEPSQPLKDVSVDLPPGFIGDPLAAPTCPQALLDPAGTNGNNGGGQECPAASIIGSVAFLGHNGTEWDLSNSLSTTQNFEPPTFLYNVSPDRGHAAQFAFLVVGQMATIYANLVHTSAGYVVRVTSPSINRKVYTAGVKVTIFGDPALHDGDSVPSKAFFTNPSDCSQPGFTTTVHADSWTDPAVMPLGPTGAPIFGRLDFSESQWASATAESPPVEGCNKLQFHPEIEAQPTTSQASSPSGLNVDLKIPQNEDPEGLATPPLKNVTVTLPRGLSISPSSANGLQACSDAQFAVESTEPATCPEASVVGSVRVHTPLLAEELEGRVFVGTPECNPCSNEDAQAGRMVRLFVEIANAARGVDVKLSGRVSLSPSTGKLTASFEEAPQLPFDNLVFKFKSGERAPLSTPVACGGYTSAVDLTPWSAPYTPDAVLSPGFEVNQGCGAQGFAPAFSAGTTSNRAGAYSPFTLSFARSDSQQDFDALEATLPPGLLAKLAGVPRCGEAEANAGTCPESTRIGTVTVGAGPGSDPYYVTGQIYLTGPTPPEGPNQPGGPFGETVEVPAVAGPFNLGTVVVRGSIRVNPSTAQATVVSNPFPQILDGIPLQVKTVNVTLNREGFTFNPTNCGSMAVTGELVSTQGASAGVSAPFAAANCANLAFKPVLSASTAGRASKAGGASLDVKVAYPSGPLGTYANIKSVKVDLPKQLPSRLTTLQKACPAATFEANPASCPSASDVGTATATTPLLNVPVSGPAYLVSHAGLAFPDLDIVLQGEGVTLVLVGNTNIKKGITSSTFKAIPDAPVSSFELKVPTGKYSVLATNLPEAVKYNLCGQALSMPTAITAQNGLEIHESTKISVSGCAKKAVKKAKAKKKATSKKKGKR